MNRSVFFRISGLIPLVLFTFYYGVSAPVEKFHRAEQAIHKSVKTIEKDSANVPEKLPFFGIGISAGLNAGTGRYVFTGAPAPPMPSILFAPRAGISFDFRFGKVLSLRSDLAFIQKGDRINMADWYASFGQETDQGDWQVLPTSVIGYSTTRVNYFELTIGPAFHLSEWVYLGFGGYGSIGLFGSEKTDYSITYYLEEIEIEKEEYLEDQLIQFAGFFALEDTEGIRYFNRLDYGITGFLGFGKKPLSLEFLFQYGLETWQPSETLFSTSTKPDNTYHLSGSLNLCYWFH